MVDAQMIESMSKVLSGDKFLPYVRPAPGFYKSYTEQNAGFIRPRLLQNYLDPIAVSDWLDSMDVEGHSA